MPAWHGTYSSVENLPLEFPTLPIVIPSSLPVRWEGQVQNGRNHRYYYINTAYVEFSSF